MSKSHTIKHYWWTLSVIGIAMAALTIGMPAMTTKGADHGDAPLVALDGRIDINDVYVFTSPNNPNNTVLIMTVNPFAGVNNPTTFHPEADYDFLIDNDADAVKDIRYRINFSNPRGNGQQRMNITGPGVNTRGATRTNVTLPNGGRATAGVFDDPFFFDLNGFQNGMNFTGDDFFAGLNVSAIVLEVPTSDLGSSPAIGVWARARLNGQQVDRVGFPLINSVLLPTGLKDSYNAGNPRADRRDFKPEVVNSLIALGNDPAIADSIADSLLPDLLTNFLPVPTGFPNGRKLEDDAVDVKLSFITAGTVFTDNVPANDKPFNNTFPYLASPHSGNP